MKKKTTKRRISVEVEFYGDGRVINLAGGVAPPKLSNNVKFLLHREILEDGLLGPVPGEAGLEGAFQVNIYANL